MTDKREKIDWRKSVAKRTLLDDLEHGSTGLMSSRDAWEHYQTMPEFSNVLERQFKTQFQAHRKQVSARKEQVAREEAAMREF